MSVTFYSHNSNRKSIIKRFPKLLHLIMIVSLFMFLLNLSILTILVNIKKMNYPLFRCYLHGRLLVYTFYCELLRYQSILYQHSAYNLVDL